jgi:hypothetical protein
MRSAFATDKTTSRVATCRQWRGAATAPAARTASCHPSRVPPVNRQQRMPAVISGYCAGGASKCDSHKFRRWFLPIAFHRRADVTTDGGMVSGGFFNRIARHPHRDVARPFDLRKT